MTAWSTPDGTPAGLPFDDRSWQFGDGIFETIAVRSGEPRCPGLHFERALVGCRRLGLEPPGKDQLESVMRSAIKAATLDTSFAILKLVITGGRTPRGYARSPDALPNIYTGLFAAEPLPSRFYSEGVRVRLCNTQLARQPQLAGMKTLNRLEQVLARNEWRDPEIFEGLCFDTDGSLICGTMSNVFLVENKSLVTPDLSHAGVAGIMRRVVTETAAGMGIDCAVRPVTRDEIATAREVFLTNSQFGILPVSHLSDHALETGETTRRLMLKLRDMGMSEIAC